MDQDALLAHWRRVKAGARFYRLRAPVELAYEYRGPQWGHPANYAAVRFACAPAARLTYASRAEWPADVDPERYETAISLAVIDALLGAQLASYRGCALTLIEIGWDDVMSAPAAFYTATRRVLADLLADHTAWEFIA